MGHNFDIMGLNIGELWSWSKTETWSFDQVPLGLESSMTWKLQPSIDQWVFLSIFEGPKHSLIFFVGTSYDIILGIECGSIISLHPLTCCPWPLETFRREMAGLRPWLWITLTRHCISERSGCQWAVGCMGSWHDLTLSNWPWSACAKAAKNGGCTWPLSCKMGVSRRRVLMGDLE